MKTIILTGRQALICERAIEMLETSGHGMSRLEADIKEFSGKELAEEEMDDLKETLQG